MIFICMRIKRHVHINGFAVSLTLKQRLWATQKWSVEDTSLMSPPGKRNTILRGHLSHTKSSCLKGKGRSFISQLLSDPEYWSDPRGWTRDLLFCSQALYQGCMSLKVMLHETTHNNDFLHNTALQHCYEIVWNRYSIIFLTLQHCVALKVIVANHTV